eukprot:CAMPEP_0179874786 /NCGR_PEP_ID=MMETSP0982-20121206/23097_1 /TAXON_ID=483367 /ORGANISM="non described non described, Strain CCMP 2436" /LENGTH=110 /DNA_ID=CAMNT_0021766651 /DNA_START=447 /DNA_END=775 /DNA_ORIENTATION=-
MEAEQTAEKPSSPELHLRRLLQHVELPAPVAQQVLDASNVGPQDGRRELLARMPRDLRPLLVGLCASEAEDVAVEPEDLELHLRVLAHRDNLPPLCFNPPLQVLALIDHR